MRHYSLFHRDDAFFEKIDEFVAAYRKRFIEMLPDNHESIEIREEMEKKIKCEKAGMATPGAVFINGGVVIFEVDDESEEDL